MWKHSFACMLFLSGCATAPQTDSLPPRPLADSNPARPDPAPDWIREWRTESIALPPAFAPQLPLGDEVLLFAPGWSTPGAEDHWSYVFQISVEELGMQLGEFLELYYDGLCELVARGKGLELPANPSTTTLVELSPGVYRGKIELFDVFGDGSPLSLNIDVQVLRSCWETHIVGQVSPQERSHAIWRKLDAAIFEFSGVRSPSVPGPIVNGTTSKSPPVRGGSTKPR